MKILFAVDRMSGGIERLFVDIVSHLSNLGNDVVVVSMESSGPPWDTLKATGVSVRIIEIIKDIGFFRFIRSERTLTHECP